MIARRPMLLATLNARYAHASFGLRYLLANMPPDLRARTRLLELEVTTPRLDALERILAHDPAVVGFGVYVWNVAETTALVADLKRVRPEVRVVLGGPEVSHETEEQEIARLADVVVTGEADLVFPGVARALLAGETVPRIVLAPTPRLEEVLLPYDEYTDEDVARRVVYVEASRGCPYRCEFCLSALDVPVRAFPLEPFLAAMQRLLDRGARNFKFVDRTFNLSPRTSSAILRFFLERVTPDLHLHFELVPDRLPDEVRALARAFPAGVLQFEIGIQTFTPGVNELVSRRQDDARACENLRFLRDETRVHVHAGLIFGLPGETLATFGASVDRLVALVEGDVQVGILKRLRGAPIVRHSERLVFSPTPPYEVLRTDTASFEDVTRVKRFAKVFEAFWNARAHRRAFGLAFAGRSVFEELLAFSDWLHARTPGVHGHALVRRYELLWEWLASRVDREELARAFVEDFYGGGTRSERLAFLEPFVDREALLALQRRNRARSHVRSSAGDGEKRPDATEGAPSPRDPAHHSSRVAP